MPSTEIQRQLPELKAILTILLNRMNCHDLKAAASMLSIGLLCRLHGIWSILLKAFYLNTNCAAFTKMQLFCVNVVAARQRFACS